jgi:hypothetical protein
LKGIRIILMDVGCFSTLLQAGYQMVGIPALRKLRQGNPKFKASLGYITNLSPAWAAEQDTV